MFEFIFNQVQNNWKHNSIPIEISKNNSDRVADLLIYKIHYALSKKLSVILGNLKDKILCRGCLNSYTSETMLMTRKPKCEINEITTIKTSSKSHPHWKDHFHKTPLYFSVIADFKVDNEIVNSNIGNKTTNVYKQNSVCNGYYIHKIIPKTDEEYISVSNGCIRFIDRWRFSSCNLDKLVTNLDNGGIEILKKKLS